MNDLSPCVVIEEVLLGNGTSVITVRCEEKEKTYTVSTRLLRENGVCKGGKLSFGDTELLSFLENVTKAIKKGLDLLSYSDSSKASLVRKLMMKGFDREISELATAQLEKTGFIKEEDHALRLARSLVKQLYGPRAVEEKLKSKGFEKKYVKKALEAVCSETDHVENLHTYAEKHGLLDSILSPDDPLQYKRTCAKILRRGFSYEHISQLKTYK